MKKVALTPLAFRMSRIFGVHSGSGPSSKVRARTWSGAPRRRMVQAEGQALQLSSVIRPLDGIALQRPLAGPGLVGHGQQLALAGEGDGLGQGHGPHGRIGLRRGHGVTAEHLPAGRVLLAQRPKGRAAQAAPARHGHGVGDGGRVLEPDLVHPALRRRGS
jgi:hypothetical protein